MFELVSVEAHNFRSFGNAFFTPLGAGQGLTAINGANGTGKSSIATHAILWCLYGVTPDGVNVKALRRQDSEGEVSVTVTFRHNKQTIEVKRALRGRNDTTVASVALDGEEQTNISARTATTWVENRLGIDAEAFLTAFVVRQKEVDSLVRARPAERRALVERLAGIDRLSTALAKAREKSRQLTAVANAITVNINVDDAREEAAQAEQQHAEAQEQLRQAVDRMDAATRRLGECEAAAEAAEAASREITALESQVGELRVHAMSAERDRDRLLTECDGADRLADVEAAIEDIRAALADARKTVTDADETKRRAVEADRRASEERAQADKLEAKAQQAEQVAADAEQQVAEPGDTVVEAVESLTSQAAALRTDAEVKAAETRRLRKVVEELRSLHDAACPTCRQGLDNPAALLNELEEDAVRQEQESRDAAGQAAEVEARRDAAVADLNRWRETAQKAHQLRSEATQARLRHEEQARRASLAEEECETLAEQAHDREEAAATARDAIPEYEREERALQTALRKAETAQEALGKLPSAEQTARQAVQALDDALTALQEARNKPGGVPDVEAARQAHRDAYSASQEASRQHATAATAASLAESTLRQKRHELDEAERAAEAKRAALRDAEIAAAAASSIEEFRLDRLSRLAPELSEVASDIVATMTEGRYNAVELDEDFTPIVTESATGQQRPIAWLSGGEESAVALALRLAIGDVVAGQNVGVLILDEVLAAHDKDRRAAVMAAIRALPHRQVITINHASEATDQVDLIAHVTPTPEGSLIDHHAGETSGSLLSLET